MEIDLRSHTVPTIGLHLAHDPWSEGPSFDSWVQKVKRQGLRGPIILNTKEDGLEDACLRVMATAGISNFWFLDTTLPALVKWAVRGHERRFAVRYSSYEPRLLAERFAGFVDWVWVDCFEGVPADIKDVEALSAKFKICLVSPELQVGVSPDLGMRIEGFKHLAPLAAAVCSKHPELWQSK